MPALLRCTPPHLHLVDDLISSSGSPLFVFPQHRLVTMSDAAPEAVPRQGFRPSRGRASLSALPSTTVPNKENGGSKQSSPAKSSRKKRAHSLGGEALERAVRSKEGFTLSPGQQARRKLVSLQKRRGFEARRSLFVERNRFLPVGSSSLHSQGCTSHLRRHQRPHGDL